MLVELARVKGSAPREEGAWMSVNADAVAGTIGGGQLEWRAIEIARQMLADQQESSEVDIPLGPDIGQCCGGRVTLRAAIEPDGRLAIVVTDTGAGMRRADIPKAMEAFGQVAGDKTRYAHEGTGLGLPITAALVRLHGGTLVIDSQIGRGTSATLRFPHERILDAGQVAAA